VSENKLPCEPQRLPAKSHSTSVAGIGLGCPPCVKIIPVQDRVKGQKEAAVRLVPPERADAEQHDMPFAERRVDKRRPARQVLASDQSTGEKQIVGIGRV